MSPSNIFWSSAISAGFLAGVFATILVVPFFGPAVGMMVAGAVCVILYRRQRLASSITSAFGAKLGTFSGLIEVVILTLVICVHTWATHAPGGSRSALLHGVERTARFADPEITSQWIETLKPASLAGLVLILLVGLLVCSAFGGAAVGMIYGRKVRY